MGVALQFQTKSNMCCKGYFLKTEDCIKSNVLHAGLSYIQENMVFKFYIHYSVFLLVRMTYEDRTDKKCSKTKAHKIQTQENHPQEIIQNPAHQQQTVPCDSLTSEMVLFLITMS